MKKTKKMMLLFVALLLPFLWMPVVSAATDTSGGGGGSGNDSRGGNNGDVPCVSDSIKRQGRYYPNTYMIDLVKRGKDETGGYWRVASAVVGEYATDDYKSMFEYASKNDANSPRSKAKFISTGWHARVSSVGQIDGLAGLAKYLDTNHSVSNIGTSLSTNQVWAMLVDFGVAEKKGNSYAIKSDMAGKFNIGQSPKLTDRYGYRILIQEFHAYLTVCNSSGRRIFALRKESSVARDASENTGTLFETHELMLPDDALGITGVRINPWDKVYVSGFALDRNSFWYLDKNWMSDKMHGAGYNMIWMDFSNILEKYKCDYDKSSGECSISSQKSGETAWNKVAGKVNCTGQTSYNGYTLQNACPNITYTCRENEKTYGKCYIDKNVVASNGSVIETKSEEVNCNDGKKGKTTYNGYNLQTSCPFKPKYNYDVDVVCENCEDNNTNGSYQIQDISNWKAIVHSLKRTDKTTLMTYYWKADKILCREEFNIVLPNANTVRDANVKAGGYFTVNEKGSTIVNNVYNFEPIKVTRTRQCIDTDNDIAALINYSKKNQIKEFGTINLKYIETKYGHVFSGDKALKADTTRTKKYPSTTSNVQEYTVITDKADSYFKLDDDIYRYVSTGSININGKTYENGESVVFKPTEDSEKLKMFRDLKVANLPISFDNKEGATVGLNYQLPSDSKLSEIIKKGKANELEPAPTEDNAYQTGTNLENSACARMYSVGTAKYRSCVSERAKNLTAAENCLKQFGNYNTENFTYSCKIKPGDGGCYPLAVSNGSEQKYICKDGTVCDAATYAGEGASYNSKKSCGKKCVNVNGHYYGQQGEDLGTNKTEFDRQCSAPVCDLDCPEPCNYCCPDTTMMCAVYDSNTGQCGCPGKGKRIIYRTIDLTNPFPGRDASGRDTGANWCFVSLNTNKVICTNNANASNLNPIVYRQITNNRGTKTDSVYNKKPMYAYTLTPQNIEEIRKYNKKYTYEDTSQLEALAGGMFYSKFVHGEVVETNLKLDDESTCKQKSDILKTTSGVIKCAEVDG